MSNVLSLVRFLFVCGCLVGLAPLAKAKVSVAGMRIVGEAYGEDNGMGLRAFNWNTGSYLALLLVHEEGGLIDFDANASELTEFKDDTGKSLLRGTDSGFGEGIKGFASFSDDGKAMMFEVESTKLPADGARALKAKGTIAIRTASGEATERSGEISVKEGEELSIGEISFVLGDFGKPQWSQKGYPFSLALKAKQELGSIREVRFLDKEGDPIAHENGSRNSMRMVNSVSEEWYFNFPEKPESFVVELVLFTGQETIEVPFDVTASISL